MMLSGVSVVNTDRRCHGVAHIHLACYLPAMTIPSSPEIMRPLLEYLAKANRAAELNDICEGLAECFPVPSMTTSKNDWMPSIPTSWMVRLMPTITGKNRHSGGSK